MARPEIPSIVVHNGSASSPGSPRMDLSPRSLSEARSLSKQTSLAGDDASEEDPGCCEVGDLVLPSPATSSPYTTSLPLTPSSPSPIVSSTPVSTPSSSPAHYNRSASPCSANDDSTNPSAANSSIPPGPGPGGGEVVDCVTDTADSPSGAMAVGPVAPQVVPGVPTRSRSLELSQQRSSDSEKDAASCTSSRQRSYHSNKFKLLQRSHAMRDETSPPPEMFQDVRDGSPMLHAHSFSNSSNNLTVTQGPPMVGPTRRRLRHQGSSQGSFDGSSPCLSRDSSMEYTDSTGVDLLQFIIQTLHKNQKDRMLLLKIERELISIVKDPKRIHHKFPQMSSYQRMLVHRCAAYFGLDHNVDQVGTCVVVNKTRSTRLPDIRFKDHIRDELMIPSDEPRRSILRRGYASFEDNNFRSPDRLYSIESRRSKSFEEREEEYEKAKRRIFSDDQYFASLEMSDPSGRRCHYPFERQFRRGSHDESRWPDPRHYPLSDSEAHRKHHDNLRMRNYRLPKGESFESHDALNPRCLRPPVFKSHSFGGYSGGVTVLSRGDSDASNPSSRLSKQDSTGSRFSDHSSSSGYKTQRQDTSSTNVSNTLSTTPSPTTGPPGHYQHPSFGQHAGIWGGDGDSQPVMWAVTDMEAVPHGAMLINPQSGQPFMNSDGTLYRYDPNNPPMMNKAHSPKGPMTKDRESNIDKKLQDVTETDPSTCIGAPARLSSPSLGENEPIETDHPESEVTLVTCSSPDKQFGPHRISSSDSMLGIDESKADLIEAEDCSEHASCNSKSDEGRIKRPSRSRDDEESHFYSHFVHQSSSVEGRPYSRDSVSDVSRELRGLMLSGGSDGPPEISSPPSISAGTPVPHGYVIPRHQYAQAIYYVPPSSVANLSGGGMKYVYQPYHQMTHAQGAAQPPSHPGSSMGTHPTGPPGPHTGHPMQSLSSVGNLSTMPPSMVGHGPQHNQSVGDAGTPLPPGYIPGNYTMLAYPSSNMLGTVTSTAGGHESGGTTYYCHIPGPPAPHMGQGSAPVGNTNGPSAPPNHSLSQYGISSTTSGSSYPVALNYYSAAGVNNSGMFQNPGMTGYNGGMYAAPQSHHGGLVPQNPQTAVSFRAQTPPHTPCTQGVSLPLAFNSTGGAVPPSHGMGNQYIAVLPPPQPPTPTTHAPQLYQTFFRPSVQMISGSTGTPPPQPILHYGGISGPVPLPPGAVSPHPPVFGKPFSGGLLSGFMGESQGGGGAGKDEGKRYAGSGGGPMPHIRGSSSVAHVPPPHHHHLLPRPYSSFMQS